MEYMKLQKLNLIIAILLCSVLFFLQTLWAIVNLNITDSTLTLF